MLTHVDLFSGIGGFALAARWTGFQTQVFCEQNKYCQMVLHKHWPDVPIINDIFAFKGADYEKATLLTGGFPCQPFSSLGKRTGASDDRDLWPEMFRVIRESKPRWIVGENVAGFITMEFSRTISDLESEDYNVQSFIIPACAVNAQHRRDRIWVVANTMRTELHISKSSSIEKFIQNSKAAITLYQALPPGSNRWSSEPSVGRVVHGIPSRLDRLRIFALGNAIVPQVAFQIIKGIAIIEETINGENSCE